MQKRTCTTTAIINIYDKLYSAWEDDCFAATLSSDLSAAFDTIDHKIMAGKLEHYGIRGQSLKLFNSYFLNRKQFVQLGKTRSIIRILADCSIGQGTKLSGLLFGLYLNEFNLIHKCMSNSWYTKITAAPTIIYQTISHLTISYVDDSNHIISGKSADDIKFYLYDFYKLLDIFYTVNKVKINCSKTGLIVSCKPKFRKSADKIYFFAENNLIIQKSRLMVLGFYIQNNLLYNKQINDMVSKGYNRLNQLRSLSTTANFNSCLAIANAIVFGSVNYGIPILINADKKLLMKLHKLIMSTARCVIGSPCYKMSTKAILNKLNWLSLYQTINFSSIKLFRKIVMSNCPKSLKSKYKVSIQTNRRVRVCPSIYTKNIPKLKMRKESFVFKSCELYSYLPNQTKALNEKQFIKSLRQYIINYFPANSINADYDNLPP